MLQGVSQAQRRRKHLTYGKAPRKPANDFSYDLDSYFDEKRVSDEPSSPVRLPKAGPSVKKAPGNNEHLFDIPTSDDEDDNESRSSVKSIPSKRSVSVRSTPKPSKKRAQAAPSQPPKQVSVPNSQNGVKRKRPTTKAGQPPPKTSGSASASAPVVQTAKAQPPRREFDVPASPTRSEMSSIKSNSVTPKAPKVRKLPQPSRQGQVPKLAQKLPTQPRTVQPESRSRSSSPTSPAPSAPESPTTPQTQIRNVASPGTQASIFSTPRQKRLWDDLIGADGDAQRSSDGIPIVDGRNHDSGQASNHTGISNRPQSSWDDLIGSAPNAMPKTLPSVNLVKQMESKRKKTRLIDTLAPSASPSEQSESESDHRSDDNDDDMDIDVPPQSQSSVDPAASSSFQASSSQTRSNVKFTYAGQRSYLKEPVNDMDALLNQPLDLDASTLELPTRSSNALPQPAGTQPEDEEDDNQAVRNIHELRAAGDAHRFAEEMEQTISELTGGRGFGSKASLSARRSAWLELSEKLVAKQFRDRFLQHGYDSRAFVRAKDETDPVIGFVIASAIALILDSGSASETADHLLSSGIKPLLMLLLDLPRDIGMIVKDRATNMSKVAQSALVEFGKIVVSAPIWGEMTPKSISPCLMSLKALESIVRRLRESGSPMKILDNVLLDKLLSFLTSKAASFKDTSEAISQDVVAQSGLVISILESCTISPECSGNINLWSRRRITELVTCLDSVLSSASVVPKQLHNLVFRLCLNLANNNERNSEFFATKPYIGKLVASIRSGFEQLDTEVEEVDDIEASSAALDSLILSLGALINLAEWSDTARQVTIEANESDTAKLLDGFVKSRNSASQADSLAKSRANVPYGYLAVLLANLCQNQGVKSKIQTHLPNKQLNILIEAVEEFIAFHKAADRSEKGNDIWVAFTQRLQRIADVLKESAAVEV